MALTHLLDTSVFCQPIKPRPLAPVILRWEALGDRALAVSVLCQAEVLYGIALNGAHRRLVDSTLVGHAFQRAECGNIGTLVP